MGGPACFDRIKKFDDHDLTAKHCYFGCSRSPDVNGIKILYKNIILNCNVIFYKVIMVIALAMFPCVYLPITAVI